MPKKKKKKKPTRHIVFKLKKIKIQKKNLKMLNTCQFKKKNSKEKQKYPKRSQKKKHLTYRGLPKRHSGK